MSKPFFRADQVGSLLRPPELIAAREQFQNGQIDRRRGAARQIGNLAVDAAPVAGVVDIEINADGYATSTARYNRINIS